MVQIIHRGVVPGEKWLEGSCTNCNSRVRFQRKEGTEKGYYISVKCPLEGCSHDISVLKPEAKNVGDSYWGR